MSDEYYCPTSMDIEHPSESGFQVCCNHPELHEPVVERIDEIDRSLDIIANVIERQRERIDHNRFCVYCQKTLSTRVRFLKHVREQHPGTYAAQAVERGEL